MKTFAKFLFNFYISSSIHVALAVCSLVCITCLYCNSPIDINLIGFVFFATITGYNFVKYAKIARLHHLKLTKALKYIQLFSLFSFVMLCYLMLKMPKTFQIISLGLAFLTALYVLPVLPKFKTLRTVTGLKIFIIAIVWAIVAGVLPSVYFDIKINFDIILITIQHFCFVVAITLIFDIRDLKFDNLSLSTIPQRFGVKKTKVLGYILLAFTIGIQGIRLPFLTIQSIALCIISITAGVLLKFASEHQSKYYAAFWVEALPIFWVLILLVLTLLF